MKGLENMPIAFKKQLLITMSSICCIMLLLSLVNECHADWEQTQLLGLSHRNRTEIFEGNLSMSAAPQIEERSRLILEISTRIDNLPPIELVFRLPEGIISHDEISFANLSLQPNMAQRYSIEIEATQIGVYALQASVYWRQNGISQAQHFYAYLAVDEASSRMSEIPLPLAYMQRLKPIHREGELRRSNRAVVGAQEVHLHGQIRYFDDNQRLEVPIRRVRVRLFEQNTYQSDQEIEVVETDENGIYSFPTIDNVDPEDGSKRDVYVIITFENSALKLTLDSSKRWTEFAAAGYSFCHSR